MSGQKSTITKKYRCRYFEEDGRPIHPTCNQGDSCRFVHPADAQWPGLKPFIDTRLFNKTSSASKKNREVSRIGPFNHSSESRGPALVSQSDLFHRSKVEGDEQLTRCERNSRPLEPKLDYDRDLQRDRDRRSANDNKDQKGHSRNRSLSPVRPRAQKYDRIGSDNVRKPEVEANRNKGLGKQGLDLGGPPKRLELLDAASKPKNSVKVESTSSPLQNPRSTELATKILTTSLAPSSPKLSNEQARAEKLVHLFRNVARFSNQVVQETATHEKEGQKLQTYTEISSALSKISASAAGSVAPTLADIMIKHEQSKHRIEESFKALGNVWEQVFDVFVTEVVHVVDARLQNAITTIKNEGEHAVRDIVANATGSLKHSSTNDVAVTYDKKRARTRGPMEKENEDSRSGRGTSRDRDHKRRRFASRSSSPDSHDRRTSRHGDSNIEEILMKMKMKIDQQAESLQILTKENSELKTTLKQTAIPPASSCSSFSVSSTPPDRKGQRPRSANTTPTKSRLSVDEFHYFRTPLRDGQ